MTNTTIRASKKVYYVFSIDLLFKILSKVTKDFFTIMSTFNYFLLLQPISSRMRQAMFPETMDDGMEIPQPQMEQQQQQEQTAVQRMAEPAQMMKTAVSDLCNYQNDTDLANRAIPELIRLLTQGDVQTVQQASMTVNQLTKKEASCHAVMSNFQMVDALVRTATSSQDPDTVKSTVGAMHNMSHHR